MQLTQPSAISRRAEAEAAHNRLSLVDLSAYPVKIYVLGENEKEALQRWFKSVVDRVKATLGVRINILSANGKIVSTRIVEVKDFSSIPLSIESLEESDAYVKVEYSLSKEEIDLFDRVVCDVIDDEEFESIRAAKYEAWAEEMALAAAKKKAEEEREAKMKKAEEERAVRETIKKTERLGEESQKSNAHKGVCSECLEPYESGFWCEKCEKWHCKSCKDLGL